ncbi:MAG: type II toxin-antitoxin system VapC family toxin [Planctomycetota bacterium]
MPAVLADSGPLYALFDSDDPYHPICRNWLADWHGDLVTTSAVITETTHLLGRRIGTDAQLDLLEWIGLAVEVDDATGDDLEAISAIIRKYHDLPADFADATLVALANRRGIYDVISVDSDFTVYATAARRDFRNLLADKLPNRKRKRKRPPQ